MTILSVFPCLRISSRATIDWYVDALGFELVAAYPDSGDGVEYGGRHCSVRDPDGNLWSFGSYRGEGT